MSVVRANGTLPNALYAVVGSGHSRKSPCTTSTRPAKRSASRAVSVGSSSIAISAGAQRQRNGQRTATGTDFDDEVRSRDRRPADETSGGRSVTKEVLR
jgi:hypothetical protein